MMNHVPHQIVCTFVFNLQHIYAPQRLKPPFSRNDQVRLYVLEKPWNSCNYERIAS